MSILYRSCLPSDAYQFPSWAASSPEHADQTLVVEDFQENVEEFSTPWEHVCMLDSAVLSFMLCHPSSFLRHATMLVKHEPKAKSGTKGSKRLLNDGLYWTMRLRPTMAGYTSDAEATL